MKHSFSISFHGEVNSTPEEATREWAGSIADLVKESFKPDAQAGVTVRGMSIHIDEMTAREDEVQKKDA